MQLHCQMQDTSEGNGKEDMQGQGPDTGPQQPSKGPPLKTQLKDDSLTHLSDFSKANR